MFFLALLIALIAYVWFLATNPVMGIVAFALGFFGTLFVADLVKVLRS